MEISVRRYDDPEEFRRDVVPFLAEREAEHNLLLGIAARFTGGPYRAPDEPYMATVGSSDRIRLVALLTPPFRLVLSEGHDVTLELLIDDVRSGGWRPAGVLGPTARAFEFARRWNEVAGGGHRPAAREWIYRLEAVRFPAPIAGRLRAIEARDQDTLVDWVRGFYRDAMQTEVDAETARASVSSRLANEPETAFVWDDGAPRSMAMLTGPTPNGIRINGVYTPPELRGRGYARACVAALSARALSDGRRFCFLFADADYPTSNFVYQSIGYERVTEVQEIDFTDA